MTKLRGHRSTPATRLDRLALAGFGDGRLTPFADLLWTAATPVRFGGSWFPHVMTVVQLAPGSLLLHSPCRPSASLIDALANLGSVAHVVAPNWFHDLYLAEYRKLFPAATFWGQRMLRTTQPPWFDRMPHFTLSGLLSFDESIFFHTPSRTLIVADLLMNARAGPTAPAMTRLGYRFLGLDGKLVIFPILRWFGFSSRRSLRDAAQRIIAWNPERLIVGHGTPVESDVPRQLQAAFRYAGPTSPRRLPPRVSP